MNHTVSLILHHKILSVHRITAIWVFFIMISFIIKDAEVQVQSRAYGSGSGSRTRSSLSGRSKVKIRREKKSKVK